MFDVGERQFGLHEGCTHSKGDSHAENAGENSTSVFGRLEAGASRKSYTGEYMNLGERTMYQASYTYKLLLLSVILL